MNPTPAWLQCAISLVTLGGATSSCAIFGAPEHCSDLEVGDQLLVTIREPLDEPACAPALGFVDGAELRLSVEEFGPSSACNSAIGPFTMEALDPMYWREAAEQASGGAAFASTAHTTLGTCTGILGLDLEQADIRATGELDIFDTVEVTYTGATDGSACPGYCNARYAVDVERL